MRADLTGGYTDIEPIVSSQPSPTINLAINKAVEVRGSRSRNGASTIVVRDSRGLRLQAGPQEANELAANGGIIATISRIIASTKVEANLDIKLELPLGCGAGTSGAITVAVSGCLFKIVGGEDIPNISLPHFAATMERLAGHIGGIQDQLAAANGGFRCYSFGGAGVEYISLGHAAPLLQGMMLAIPPESRRGAHVVQLVMDARTHGDRTTNEAITQLGMLGKLLFSELSAPRPSSSSIKRMVGSVVRQQRRLHPQVEHFIDQTPLWPLVESGECAAKPLGGAGSGAAWIILPPITSDIVNAVAGAGWELVEVGIRSHGVLVYEDGEDGTKVS